MLSDDKFIDICENSTSMSEASSKLGLHFNTFKRRATKLGCYKPNQSGKGIPKKGSGIDLYEILEGRHPHYQTFKLKKRLLKEGILTNKCEECGIVDWNGKKINMELDHIDGERTNHMRYNLRLLCPNCHSQTETYRGKNKKNI